MLLASSRRLLRVIRYARRTSEPRRRRPMSSCGVEAKIHRLRTFLCIHSLQLLTSFLCSADASIQGEATGAMSWAFINALKKNPNQSYVQLLNSIREELEGKYKQKPQLSSSHPLGMLIPLSLQHCPGLSLTCRLRRCRPLVCHVDTVPSNTLNASMRSSLLLLLFTSLHDLYARLHLSLLISILLSRSDAHPLGSHIPGFVCVDG